MPSPGTYACHDESNPYQTYPVPRQQEPSRHRGDGKKCLPVSRYQSRLVLLFETASPRGFYRFNELCEHRHTDTASAKPGTSVHAFRS